MNLGTNYAGKTVQPRFRVGSDFFVVERIGTVRLLRLSTALAVVEALLPSLAGFLGERVVWLPSRG